MHTAQKAINSSYLNIVFNPETLASAVRGLIKRIHASGLEVNRDFQAIVFRGMSGALVAPIVAYELSCPVVVCRKEGDSTHAKGELGVSDGDYLEGWRGFTSFIVVDDFMASGKTMNAIFKTVKKETRKVHDETVSCKGIFLYRDAAQYSGRKFFHSDGFGVVPISQPSTDRKPTEVNSPA